MPTGVTVAPNGRIFVNFPQWGDNAPFTVAELVDGKAVPYPDAATNRPDPADPAGHFISVQSVVADGTNRLWVLDTAAPNFSQPQAGGAKLVAIDLATDRVVKTIVLPPSVVLPTTYLNDVRFDLRQAPRASPTSPTAATRGSADHRRRYRQRACDPAPVEPFDDQSGARVHPGCRRRGADEPSRWWTRDAASNRERRNRA